MNHPPAFIETFTGARFQPLNPIVADIRIHDIAHALSNQCRFSGHTRQFYSVAEHSVRVSRFVEERMRFANISPSRVRELALWGLLHDSAEAYLVDLPTPLKRQEQIGAGYRAAEDGLMTAIVERFHLIATGEPLVVKYADDVLLATEVRDLMFGRPEHWGAVKELPLKDRIVPWSPSTAKEEFIRRFDELTIGREVAA